MCEDIGTLSTKTYRAGEVIASSQPFIHVVLPKFKGKYCDYCLTENYELNSLKKCSKCHLMYYCDRSCQSYDWNVHKIECKIYVRHMKETKCNELLLDTNLLRLIITCKTDTDLTAKNYLLHNGQQRCFNEFMSHETELKESLTQEPKKLTGLIILIDLLKQFDIEINFEELFRLIGQSITNAFYLVDYKDNKAFTYCFALYIPLSVFNHSCRPNAGFVNYGKTMQIKAMKHIEPNEEITISYIDIQKPKIERQLELKKYFFECRCVKCETDLNEDFDYNKLNELLTEYNKHLQSTSDCYFRKSHDNLIDCIKLSELILKLRKKLIENYKISYSHDMYTHSLLLLHAMLSNVDGYSIDDIKPFINLTEDNLKITHGINHKLYKTFMLKIQA